MYRFFLCPMVFLFCCTSSLLFGQELKPSESRVNLLPLPEWTSNIVFETHAYEWFTDGDIANRMVALYNDEGLTGDPEDTGPQDIRINQSFDTDANLYIVGGEVGYRFGLPFLQRITAGVETAQGDSRSMHGRASEFDALSDEDNPWAFGRMAGWDASRYFRASLFFRPLEGKLAEDVSGFFDILGEWIKYKDRIGYRGVDVGGDEDGEDWGERLYDKYRYEGGGVGFRGGLGFFDMVSLKGQFTWYPGLSVKGSGRTYADDPEEDSDEVTSALGSNGRGKSFRVTMGFTPFKKRKNLEIECGYQYMEFEQDGGRFRNQELVSDDDLVTGKWKKASNYRDGFLVGGTLRW